MMSGRKAAAHQPEAEDQPADLGNQRRQRHAFHRPAETENEPKIEAHVHPVLPQLQRKHRPRALDPDQPAGQCVDRHRRRRRPDADGEVVAREALDIGRGGGDLQRQREERDLQGDDGEPGDGRDEKGAEQDRAQFRRVGGALGLGGQAGGAHPQEAEDPVDRRQDHRADADRADRARRGRSGRRPRCRPRQEAAPWRWTARWATAIFSTRRVGQRRASPQLSGIRKCALAMAMGRARLSCQHSTCTEA